VKTPRSRQPGRWHFTTTGDASSRRVPAHGDRYSAGGLHLRSRDAATYSGRAVGAYILARHTALDLTICECCPCLIMQGESAYIAERHDGQLLTICGTCAGERQP
jgi:hypothetical protein